MATNIQQLQDEFQDADCVWFLVDVKYRILAFNKKAAQNSVSFHNQKIAVGQSILDYARDTQNKIDSVFIQSFGKAASGHEVKCEQRISYKTSAIDSKSIFTPVYQDDELKAVSIAVHYTPIEK
jgi:hypothetical protein